ncbi:heme acquisition protein HasA [Yersinia aleksiciae]|uniref:heme acquisition protein HasA n=1 Tax=Yersinia aleksiciae TaxID=263819 RepID=UPI00119FED57|nr:heme acquisition protein HasA [Yersinia aleksiciae]
MTITIQFNAPLGSSTLANYSQTLKIENINETAINNRGDTAEAIHAQALARMCDCSTDDTVDYDFIGISTGDSCKSNAEMIIDGNLMYSNSPQHTFYGKIENLALGKGLSPNPDGIGTHLEELQLKLHGLNINSEFDSSKTIVDNRQGEVHKVIDGLIRGNADPLLEILQAQGIDINTPLKDMSIASQLDAVIDVSVIDTVGSTNEGEILLAA